MYPEFKIIREELEVDARLADFPTTREELLRVVHAVVGAKNSAVITDPLSAPGLLGYIFGTRALREIFLPKAWEMDRTNNIEATFNPQSGTKIIFQNVDNAADPLHDPKAISGKGPASERMVALSQPSFFPEWDAKELARINASVWFFCVSKNGEDVRAELSRPLSIQGGQFGAFIERIFIVKSREWGRFDPSKFDDSDLENQNFEVSVTRK